MFCACTQEHGAKGAKGGSAPMHSKSGGKGGKSALLMLSTNIILFHILFLHLYFLLSLGVHDLPRNAKWLKRVITPKKI